MNEFLVYLKTLYKDGAFSAEVAEEFLNVDGSLDLRYIQHLLKIRTTLNKFSSDVNSTFSTVKFPLNKDIENQVTKEEFFELYEFAKYPQARSWIGHFSRVTGKLLTREKLHEYVLSTSRGNNNEPISQ